MIEDKAIELLKKVRPYLNNHSGFATTSAVYITPAQSLRNSADAMEAEEALIREVDEFLNNGIKS